MPVRRVWAHEEYEFTPWLAENLHLLGETLDLNLELVGREQPVGPYSLDILAKETKTGVFVAIENQLEWADTHHLGQLLTYTAGRDTRIGIWVATEFGHEHAQALHWLNQWTAPQVGFYAVKVEAVRPSVDSEPEARFHKVVWPSGWDKKATPEPGTRPGVEYETFFRPLVTELMRTGFSDRQPFRRFGASDRSFHSRMNPGIQYSASLEGVHDAWVTLRIQTENTTLTQQIFDALNTEREHIEKAYDADPEPEWYWNGKNRYGWCSISIRTQGSVHDPQARLEETRQWMLNHLPKFKDFFDPRVNKILQQLDG